MDKQRRSLLTAGLLAAGGGLLPRQVRAATEGEIFPVVETAQGRVRGLNIGGVRTFKGLHYGADTSGKNRFMPPQPPAKWAGIRDTFDYGQFSPQMPLPNLPGAMGEDCLVVNIWTPKTDRTAKLPVLVHLHGGALVLSSGNSPAYDGEKIARYGQCVFVTVNHRLGVFGALNLAEHSSAFPNSGQAGMMDIVAALKWVQENIAGFGGDPSRVLVFGQSGGGEKTLILMAMPSAKGLFQRAGVMSSGLLRLPTAEKAQSRSALLLKTLGVAKGDRSTLQSMSMETLLTAEAALGANGLFDPSIDGAVIPVQPFESEAPAVSADVPLIISTTLDERAYLLTNYELDEAGLRALIAKRVGEARADEVLAVYRDEDPYATPFLIQARFVTDEAFRKPMYLMAERKAALAAKGGAPVWSYLWKRPSVSFGGRYGALHLADLGPSLHDLRDRMDSKAVNGTDAAVLRLTDQLSSSWVAFAATGDPNNKTIPHWAPYSVPDRTTMVFDQDAYVANDPRSRSRVFWEKEPSPYGAGGPYELGSPIYNPSR